MTAREQLLLDLINRARIDPAGTAAQYGINLNEGLAPGTISADPKQPLAPHQALIDAAGLHSQDMLDNDYFSHTNLSGQQPWDRATAAGYPPAAIAENIAWGGSTGPIDQEAYVYLLHENLFVDSGVSGRGHRLNMLNAGYRELGPGVRYGVYTYAGTDYNSAMVTELFGNRGGNHFLTGVVFDDLDGDDRYDPGEGLGGVTVTTGALTTTTGSSGGWCLEVADGEYVVTASGGSFSGVGSLQATVSGANVELDFVSGLASGYVNYVLADVALGPVTFQQLSGLDPSAGELWYVCQASRDGVLTVDAAFDPGAGSAQLTLYDEGGSQLAVSTLVDGNQRIDWDATAGQTFRIRLSGTSSEVDLRLVNLVQPSPDGTAVSVFGTDGDDTFQSVAPAAAPLVMTVNGVRYDSTAWPSLGSVSFVGGAGSDTAAHTGSDADEVASLDPTSGTVTGPDYTLTLSEVESITVESGGGTDVAYLRGDPGQADTFRAWPETARLSGAQYDNCVESFRYVHAYGTTGNTDVAYLYGDPGQNDTFEAWPETARRYGAQYYNRVKSFRYVHAYGTTGNTDVARLYGDPGQNDTFQAWPEMARLYGAQYYNRVKSFRYVHAYGTTGNSDVAYLYGDPAQNDTFQAWPETARLYGAQYWNGVKSFRYVHAYGTTGNNDVAYLRDSSGNDIFQGWSQIARLYGSGFYNRVKSFRWVHGYAGGGTDRAELYGSGGNDVFLGTSSNSRLYGSGFYNRVNSFEKVEAYGAGGDDVAELHDAILETGLIVPVDASSFVWLYDFDQIRQVDTGTGDESIIDVVDQQYTAYWQ
jgi:hypothetical protein